MPLKFGEKGYDITENPDWPPLILLKSPCRRIYVEFLENDDSGTTAEQGNKTTHPVIKFDFEHKIDEIYCGALLYMNPKLNLSSLERSAAEPNMQAGQLLLKPVRYSGCSEDSVWTCLLPSRPHVTLESIIGALVYRKMQFFRFATINDKYYGCRDFISQALYILENDKYIRLTIEKSKPARPGLGNNILKVLGYCFTPESAVPCPIDKGRFIYYERKITDDMMYTT